MLSDVCELKKVGSTDAIDVLAQVDRHKDAHTRRYHLGRETTPAQDQLAELHGTNTGARPSVATSSPEA